MIWSFKTENPFEVNIGEGFRTAERSKLKSHDLERKKKGFRKLDYVDCSP